MTDLLIMAGQPMAISDLSTEKNPFLTEEDYRVVIGERALQTISQTKDDIRHNAELEAIEEVASYLMTRFDTRLIFSRRGKERNKLIVMRTVDVALYHLSAAMPGKLGSEIRQERYERAIRWLKEVAQGTITPNLPKLMGDETETAAAAAFMLDAENGDHNAW